MSRFRFTCFLLVGIGYLPTNVNAEVTSIACRVKSPQEDSPRSFELIIDREERRILECFRSRSGIVTQEFSEISISAECPISEGGKRSFRLTRDTGAVTVSEVLTKPIVSRRTFTGECEVGQIRSSTPNSAEVPGSARQSYDVAAIQDGCKKAMQEQSSMEQTDIDNTCKCVSDTMLSEHSAVEFQGMNKEEIKRSAREANKTCYVKLGVAPQATSKKHDIQGISLGMTEQEANIVITPGKRPSLVFTKALEPSRICEIEHIFQSGTSPREMISIVSEQFNMTPVKADWSAEIAHATTSRLEEFTTMWGTTNVVVAVGGPLAQWRSLGRKLELKLNRPATPNAPNEYILKLVDEDLKKRDVAAANAKRDEGLDAQRAINPKPKF